MAPARKIRGLSCDDSFRTAAGKILWTRFEEMMSYTQVALAGEDPEGVHDMRVGSRRLRAGLEMFQDVFPRRRYRPLLREVKTLADALGEVRDTDVLLERLQNDRKGRPVEQRMVLDEIIAETVAKRDEARINLHRTIERLEQEEFGREFLSMLAQEAM